MFADRAKILIRSGKAETVTAASAENCMYQTADRTVETVDTAET